MYCTNLFLVAVQIWVTLLYCAGACGCFRNKKIAGSKDNFFLYNGYHAQSGRSMSNGMGLKQTGSVSVPPFGLGEWENG